MGGVVALTLLAKVKEIQVVVGELNALKSILCLLYFGH